MPCLPGQICVGQTFFMSKNPEYCIKFDIMAISVYYI